MVHVGFAISIVDEKEAAQVFEILKENERIRCRRELKIFYEASTQNKNSKN